MIAAYPEIPPHALRDAAGHVLVVARDGSWRMVAPTGRTLLAAAPEGFVRLGSGRVESVALFGTFRFRVGEAAWRAPGAVVAMERDPAAVTLRYGGAAPARVRFVARPDGFRIVATSETAGTSRLGLDLAVASDDRFFGFGARTNACEQRGRVVENWVQEGGNGKSERPLFGLGNLPTASHVPIPFCLSTAGVGLALDTARRTTWDVGATRPDRLGAEVDAPALALDLYPARTPAGAIAAFTARTGRPAMPPRWAFAPAEWGKGGAAAVRAKARWLREQRIPASAMWFEDWVGLVEGPLPGLTHLPWGRWRPDASRYPDLAGLNAELAASGFKSLGYFNPFLTWGDPQAAPLLRRGGTLRDGAGRPLWFPGPYGWLTQVDPTHPRARAWMRARLREFEALGFDGAMVDFGEWTPRHARFADGSTGVEGHNAYPNRWAALHHGFWRSARPDGDFVTYTRAGYTGCAPLATYLWAGDQNTDFGDDDGLPTALRAILAAGLSGVPLMTHDVAGFATLGERGVTRELYYRWVELGALTTFMRTHSGQKPSRNWHVASDAATTAHHRRYARLHMDLAPYREAVVREAVATGLPAMRHMWLAFPHERAARDRDDQYMLGPSLLVAPVLREGATSRTVWLPPGAWYDWWTGERLAGGRTITVAAPLDHLPLFARAGAVVPLLPEGIMTLAPSADPAVPGLEAAEGRLRVRAFPGPAGALRLADGSVIGQIAGPAGEPQVFVRGGPGPRSPEIVPASPR